MDLRRVVASALAVGALAPMPVGTAQADPSRAPSAAQSVTPSRTYEPPGKAGATEYAETIPASGGNVTPPPLGTISTTVGGSASSAPIAKLGEGLEGVRQDARLGLVGRAAAEFAQATAPVQATGSVGSTGPVGRPSTRRLASAVGSGSVVTGMLNLLGGSDAGGIGVFLPLALVFSLGLALGVAAWRLRPRADA